MASMIRRGIGPVVAVMSIYMAGGLNQIAIDTDSLGVMGMSLVVMGCGVYYLFLRIIVAERALEDGA